MTNNFIKYLHSIIPAPVRIKNIDGYVYEIESEPSILNERCVEGRISDKIYKRLANNKRIEKLTTWNNNTIKVRFKK